MQMTIECERTGEVAEVKSNGLDLCKRAIEDRVAYLWQMCVKIVIGFRIVIFGGIK